MAKKNTAHEELKRAAIEACQALHGDSSVDMQTTLDSLEEVQSDLETSINAVRQDLERSEEVE